MPNGVPPQSDTGYVTLPDGRRVPTVAPPGGGYTWDDTQGWVSSPQGNPNESFISYEDALARWTFQAKVQQFGTKTPAPPGWKPPPMPAGWGGSKPQGYGQPTPGMPPAQPPPSPSNTVAPLGAPPVTSTPLPSAGPSQPGYSGQMQNMSRPSQPGAYSQQPTTMQQAAPPEQPIQADPYGNRPWAPPGYTGAPAPSPYGLRTGGPGTGGDYERRTGALKSLINPSTMQSLGGQPPAAPPTPTGGGTDWSKLGRAIAPLSASAGPTFGYSAFGGTAPKQETGGGYGRAQGAPGLDLATLLQQNNPANPVDLSKLRGAMADPYATMLGGGSRGRGF